MYKNKILYMPCGYGGCSQQKYIAYSMQHTNKNNCKYTIFKPKKNYKDYVKEGESNSIKGHWVGFAKVVKGIFITSQVDCEVVGYVFNFTTKPKIEKFSDGLFVHNKFKGTSITTLKPVDKNFKNELDNSDDFNEISLDKFTNGGLNIPSKICSNTGIKNEDDFQKFMATNGYYTDGLVLKFLSDNSFDN